MKDLKNIIIFASGKGSNAAKIINYFADNQNIKVKHVFSSKLGAGVVEIAKNNHINYTILEKEAFLSTDKYIDQIKKIDPSLIILAGFLWKVPENLVKAFPNKIINIHPALLPKFGGKGMYGNFVHEAVIAAKENESGITIHLIDNHYDRGQMLFQATCPVERNDTPESLAQKVHALEYKYFPHVVDHYIDTALTRNKL